MARKHNSSRRMQKRRVIDDARMEKQKIIDAAEEKLRAELRHDNVDLREDLINLSDVMIRGRFVVESLLAESKIPYCEVVKCDGKMRLDVLVTGASSIAELEKENDYFSIHFHELFRKSGFPGKTVPVLSDNF
jgi:hypothetical protein